MSDHPKYAYDEAKKLGLEVVESSDKVLLIDLDSEEAVKEFKERLGILKSNQPKLVEKTVYTKSKSGIGNHVYVVLTKSLSTTHRIGLQAALGSDLVRELLSFCAAFNNEPTTSVLFENSDGMHKLRTAGLIKMRAA